MHASGPSQHPWAISSEGLGPRLALITVASLAAFLLFATPRAAQPDSEEAMVREFQSYCVDYYTPAQCVRAVRFALRTEGSRYFLQLHNSEAPDAFIDRLAAAVKGGDTPGAGGTLSVKAGD
jgi:hypothetical protein